MRRLLPIGLTLLTCAAQALDPGGKGGPVVADRVFSAVTRVVEVLPDGVVRPLDGADAWVIGETIRRTAHGPQSESLTRVRARTTPAGVATFEGIRHHDKATYRVVIPFQGVSYRSPEFRAMQAPPTELRVYHVSPTPRDLSLRSNWTVDVGEAFLRVGQVVRVYNDSLQTIDYAHSGLGLRIPTLSNVVHGDRVVAWGVVPPGRVHGASQPSTGQGRVEGEDGAVVFRGPVPPGSGLFFQLSYNVPFSSEAVRLGAVSDLPLSDATVTVRWTDAVQPRARLERPHRAVRSGSGTIRTDMFVHGPVPVGEALILRLDRLPVQSKLPMWVATAGSLGLLFGFAVVLVGALRRRSGVA